MTGHSRASIHWVFPSRSLSWPIRSFFLVRNVRQALSHDIPSLLPSRVLLLTGWIVHSCNRAIHLRAPSVLVVFPLCLLIALASLFQAVHVSFSFPPILILSRNESSMVCICIGAIMALDSIVISSRRLALVWISSSSKYEFSCGSRFKKHIITLSSSNVISHLRPMLLEQNPKFPFPCLPAYRFTWHLVFVFFPRLGVRYSRLPWTRNRCSHCSLEGLWFRWFDPDLLPHRRLLSHVCLPCHLFPLLCPTFLWAIRLQFQYLLTFVFRLVWSHPPECKCDVLLPFWNLLSGLSHFVAIFLLWAGWLCALFLWQGWPGFGPCCGEVRLHNVLGFKICFSRCVAPSSRRYSGRRLNASVFPPLLS